MQETEVNVAIADEETNDQESVLFVDDEKHILSSLRRLMRPLKLNTFFAVGGEEGLKVLQENKIDLVVSDMRMPHMDGAEFLTRVKQQWPDTIRMLLTGYADIGSTVNALNNGGIYRYISKPWDDEELKQIIMDGLKLKRLEREQKQLLELTNKQNKELHDLNANLEAKVAARTEEIRQANQMLDMAYGNLKESYDGFVQVFSSVINKRQSLQRAESQIVADLSKKMAIALKLKETTVRSVYHAALLHQLGKSGLSDNLLNKPLELMNDEEKRQYQEYSAIGEAALSSIAGFEKAAALIRNHTEYYDGSGFPDKLKAEQVRAGARVIRTVCDYVGYQTGMILQKKLSAEEAFLKIKELAGKKYDPIVVKCLNHFRKQYDIKHVYDDEIEIDSFALQPKMRLTRDLLNNKGMLLMSKGSLLNKAVIDKVLSLEQAGHEKFKIYISREDSESSDA